MMVINTRKGNVSYPSKFQYSLFQLIIFQKKKKNSIPSNKGGRSYNSFVLSVYKFAIYQSMSI